MAISVSKDLFPSKYLRASDLDGETNLKIKRVDVEEVGRDRDRKPVVHFVGDAKDWVLNKTNASTIAKSLGDDAEKWPGKVITVFPCQVQFGADIVDAVRVKVPEPELNLAAEMDDSIPFGGTDTGGPAPVA